jgi:hypothetical protein
VWRDSSAWLVRSIQTSASASDCNNNKIHQQNSATHWKQLERVKRLPANDGSQKTQKASPSFPNSITLLSTSTSILIPQKTAAGDPTEERKMTEPGTSDKLNRLEKQRRYAKRGGRSSRHLAAVPRAPLVWEECPCRRF